MSQLKIHFISGLPRSGSTLLAAILRQNPRFYARIESPVAPLFANALRIMSTSESAVMVSESQRREVLHSLVKSYYLEISGSKVIFDTNRHWCALMPAIASLFPKSRVIACLRNPAWILDSLERLVQQNPLLTPKIFGNEAGTVFNRVESLMRNHLVAPALNALRQAWYGEYADRLIALRYNSLTESPSEIMMRLYSLLEEEQFPHDFEHLEYEESEFDARLGMPGMHRVGTRVQASKRQTILPTELFERYDQQFWELPSQNPRGVTIL